MLTDTKRCRLKVVAIQSIISLLFYYISPELSDGSQAYLQADVQAVFCFVVFQ